MALNKKKGKNNLKYLAATSAYMLLVCIVIMLQACGNSGTIVNPSSTSTRILVVNASPDANPIKVFVGNSIPVGTYSTFFKYSFPSSYYGLSSGSDFINISTDHGIGLIRFAPTNGIKSGVSYSLFLVGLHSDTLISPLSVIFTADTSSVSKIGNGKIRFINASLRSSNLDVSANGTPAISSIKYKDVSSFVELPAGIYDFKITATGLPGSILKDVPRITIQDGRLYTLFAYGISGNRIDTAAFNAAIITNK